VSDDIPTSLTKFEGELERAIKRELARPPAGRSRPRALVGATLGLAGIATALALVLTAASSSPAFAVNRNDDGTVSVKIMRLEGVREANARLAAMNVPVQLQQAIHCAGRVPPPPTLVHPWRFRFKPGRIPAGRKLVINLRFGQLRVATKQAGFPPRPPGAAPGCLTLIPPPPCAWRVGRRMNLPLPGPRALRGMRIAPRQVAIPNCKAALSPVPAH
jgi:hypothetical protein